MKYLQVLALECLHLRQTDHLIWMSLALREKLSLPFIPGLLWCNHLLFRSFSVFDIQHFNGWMQGAILLKNMHWYLVGICFTDLFSCRTYQLIKTMLGNLTNTSAWSHQTFNPQGIKIISRQNTISTCNSVIHSHDGRHQTCPSIVRLLIGSSTPQKIIKILIPCKTRNFGIFTWSTDGLWLRKSKFIVKVFIRLTW